VIRKARNPNVAKEPTLPDGQFDLALNCKFVVLLVAKVVENCKIIRKVRTMYIVQLA